MTTGKTYEITVTGADRSDKPFFESYGFGEEAAGRALTDARKLAKAEIRWQDGTRSILRHGLDASKPENHAAIFEAEAEWRAEMAIPSTGASLKWGLKWGAALGLFLALFR